MMIFKKRIMNIWSMGLIKFKNFIYPKTTSKHSKTSHRLKKIYTDTIINKGLVSRIYRNAYKSRKRNKLSLQMSKRHTVPGYFTR